MIPHEGRVGNWGFALFPTLPLTPLVDFEFAQISFFSTTEVEFDPEVLGRHRPGPQYLEHSPSCPMRGGSGTGGSCPIPDPPLSPTGFKVAQTTRTGNCFYPEISSLIYRGGIERKKERKYEIVGEELGIHKIWARQDRIGAE